MADLSTRANDRQVGGAHYKDAGFQHWDWAADNFGAGYFLGNITKYATRWRKKNGVQDLEKALHYADKLYGLYSDGTFSMSDYAHKPTPKQFTRFATGNALGMIESRICALCCSYSSAAELNEVRSLLRDLIVKAGEEKMLTS